jgi:hypothetical protein
MKELYDIFTKLIGKPRIAGKPVKDKNGIALANQLESLKLERFRTRLQFTCI